MIQILASARRAFAALYPVALFALILLALLTAFRLGFIAWQWERVAAVQMLWPVLLQGLRFDLVLTGIACAIPALLFPLLASTRRLVPVWQTLLSVYFPVVLLLAIFMELTTPSFIAQFDSRPNTLFFEYLDHPKEIISTLWLAYKPQLLIAVVVLTAAGAALLRYFARISRVPPAGLATAILITPLLLAVCLAMIRSTMDHRPVNPSTVALSRDPMVNELALSSTYTLLYALYETRHESTGGAHYAELPARDVIRTVRRETAFADESFTHPDLPTLHFQPVAHADAAPRNLVIIVEESLGAEFVGSLGGLDLTPNIDRLSGQGLWFENLYATGTRSVRGLEAIVTGFTPTPARSVVKLPKSQRNFFTLAELLARQGFDTSFIYGGEAQFDNMRRFFMNNGFATVIDEKDYENPAFVGSWGVSDEDLFDRAHIEFSKARQKPFFSLVFTSSNHSPFQFPDGRIDIVGTEKNTVDNAVKYADFALGRFFERAKNSDYWDNTVFLVVADHNSRVYGDELVPVDRFHIPAFVLGGSVRPDRYAPVASQIDLAPTLLSLIGIAAEHPMIGHDLTRIDAQNRPGRAIMQFNGTQAYMEGNRVAVLQKDLEPAQFLYSNGRLEPVDDIDAGLQEKALAHAAWSSMAYEHSLYRLPAEPTDKTLIAEERGQADRSL